MNTKRGNELKVGDVIATWFGKQRILTLTPYRGPLSHLWNDQAHLAEFTPSNVGMTIGPDDLFEAE
jgi:hypothetical protein